MNFRVGIGVDAHRIISGRPLILGGVQIESEFGLDAHSDGDVIAHAILDALFGAAGLGDKGTHFPPTDPVYKNISSLKLLEHTADLLVHHGWSVVNVDASAVCETPRISPYVPEMRKRIAAALHIESDVVSVKGTTAERLGFTGRGEGIAAMSVVLIQKP